MRINIILLMRYMKIEDYNETEKIKENDYQILIIYLNYLIILIILIILLIY